MYMYLRALNQVWLPWKRKEYIQEYINKQQIEMKIQMFCLFLRIGTKFISK